MLLLPMLHATLISLVYPLLLLGWGALQLPKPTTRFWRVIIYYTLVRDCLEAYFRAQHLRRHFFHFVTVWYSCCVLGVLLCPQVQIGVRYFFNFSFWGDFNEPRTSRPGCEDEYFSAGCSYAVRLIGIEREKDAAIEATAGSAAQPVLFSSLVPDLLLLLFLCIHRATLERTGLWRYVVTRPFQWHFCDRGGNTHLNNFLYSLPFTES
jgi:hypothetical protein